MARKKQTRRRRTPAFSVLNALESLTYAEILTRGTTGSGVWGFFTGADDIEAVNESSVESRQMMNAPWLAPLSDSEGVSLYDGTGKISLGDLMANPSVAVSVMTQNFAGNIIPMAGAMFGTHLTFTIGKRILRKPLGKINRTLVYPLLGKSVRI